jgi:predicted membrane protein
MNEQRRVSEALLALRLSILLVMLVWTLDKLLNPVHAARVCATFYRIGGLGPGALYVIGGVELLLLAAFAVGFCKRLTYGCGAVRRAGGCEIPAAQSC